MSSCSRVVKQEVVWRVSPEGPCGDICMASRLKLLPMAMKLLPGSGCNHCYCAETASGSNCYRLFSGCADGIFQVRAGVGKLSLGGHMWPHGLVDPAHRTFTIIPLKATLRVVSLIGQLEKVQSPLSLAC